MLFDNDFVVLCQGVTSDEYDKSLSVFKIINSFNFKFTPEELTAFKSDENSDNIAVPTSYTLSSSWLKNKKSRSKDLDLIIVTKLQDESGELLYSHTQPESLSSEQRRVRFNSNVTGLTISKNGRYAYTVELRETSSNKLLGTGKYFFDVSFKVEL
jgi:hypothetical protein